MSKVVLVDKEDKKVGTEEKLKAHEENKLHRAFSVVIFNSEGEILLQKRAQGKYHSGGLWSNTCCSHPAPGADLQEAAKKRLEEEMGFTTELSEVYSFYYQKDFEGLSEHEIDHVFVGVYNNDPDPDPKEAEDWRWADPEKLKNEIEQSPAEFSFWFPKIVSQIL